MEKYDVIILGAGAAGLMCAARAGQSGMRVAVLEKTEKPGKKILISGGGRCNFTNINAGPRNIISENHHFAKSALARFTPQDFVELVDRHGIAWHEKTLGQLFCDGSAKQIVQMLLDECPEGVDVICDADVSEVIREGEQFGVMASEKSYFAPSLVIATGGPSIPKMGATGFAYGLARQFGLKVVEPRPALVPLTLGGDDVLFRDLSGVSASVEARARQGKTVAEFTEAALFTHKGLSGPAILQVSSYWRRGDAVEIDFFPGRPSGWLIEQKRENPKQALKAVLSEILPDRLATTLTERIAREFSVVGSIGGIADKALSDVEQKLANWLFHPTGTEGLAKAEVTAGGISTAELSSKTMESIKVPGLYAIGEAVDVTGWLGGYNFQWAWASAVAAAEAVATT
ncbi:MAG: NAD(P)/FAD-dependent oxidoreductase [Pseudomonadota bacterium]